MPATDPVAAVPTAGVLAAEDPAEDPDEDPDVELLVGDSDSAAGVLPLKKWI
jgi:hypothetical protein